MTIYTNGATRRRLGSDELKSMLAWGTGLTLWFVGVVAGFGILLVHDTKAGSGVHSSAAQFSNLSQYQDSQFLETLLPRGGDLQVVMALHPKCPCSANSLEELKRLLAIAPETAQCTVLVFTPEGASEEWLETASMQVVKSMVNVRVELDVESLNAERLGLSTSGACLVIDDAGEILFRGGITAGRSCIAENPGARTVACILRGEPSVSITTPVFGCKLSNNAPRS